MNDIVFINNGISKQDLYTTSDIIAEYAEVTHHAIQQIISKHENDLKEFGRVAFEMRAVEQKRGVNEQKIYQLNEQQATLVITYLKNTAPVRAFKKELVRQFFLMRNELLKRQQARAEPKAAAVSFLSADELETLSVVSNQIAVLIDLGLNYPEIKAAIKKKALTN